MKALLRQDVEYFDLHVTGTAEAISSVSEDSLVIQDVISEKVADLMLFYLYLIPFFFNFFFNFSFSMSHGCRSQTC